MARLSKEGRFKATVRESAVTVSKKSQIPQFECHFDITMEQRAGEWLDISDENMEIRCWYGLAKKNGDIIESKVDNLKDSLGWDGRSLQTLNDTDYRGHLVQLTVQFGTDENGARKNDPEVAWINPADSTGGGVTKPDANELRTLDAQWGPKLRALAPASPGAKPAAKPAASAAPASKPPTAAGGPPKGKSAATPATGTLDGAWAACEAIWQHQAEKNKRFRSQSERETEWFQLLAKVADKDAADFTPDEWGKVMKIIPDEVGTPF